MARQEFPVNYVEPTPDYVEKEAKAEVNIRTSSKIENLFEKTIVSSMLQLDQTY
ncbi:11143_t:CDS:2 [Entrophospora sp. SA101]|nr:6974_t:CDS:2 [Entrophospora sp. SA101]CAJ0911832.1 11143_t:CDS:2 [Entrophospora sp. SA101]